VHQLRATLPISIFISPNLPLDDDGNLVEQAHPAGIEVDHGAIAPPGYGEHVLDQLYEEMDVTGFQTPAIQSGVSSPFYIQSRSGSQENLSGLVNSAPFTPSALSSRLADVSLDPTQRNTSFNSLAALGSAPRSEPASNALTRSNSGDDDTTPHSDGPSGRHSPENIHIDESEFAELNKVPSYSTAVRSPVVAPSQAETLNLPDYQPALNTPRTPPATDAHPDPLRHAAAELQEARNPGRNNTNRPHRQPSEDSAAHRRIHLIQARGQVT
jgi:arrestin-related trafficking adapter 4/5/7